ncbi:hypothetical protein QU487_16335 [Crenobacter sp. SG2305]|uniref:hypothetical protein n=1 Tax=Crenobacter oryzisoli TaxID=3056844 RepID=UPI0025AB36A8|nr:hypothetical protein [Crenobacter sp. SG2305]MDN0084309.1 hypothetical protein [Crenobacter sp. SG2305]
MPNQRRARLKLAMMALLCISPVLASWGLYRSGWVEGGRSYGQLLPTEPFVASRESGWPRQRWALVSVEPAACDSICQRRRFVLKQIQAAQGEAADRLVRVRLQQPSVVAPRSDENGVVTLAANNGLDRLAGRPGYYLVDPLGNQVMFYPDSADPTRVIHELARVLKTNNGLG